MSSLPDDLDHDPLAAALRRLHDLPLPPAATDLATVTARGRRRLVARRTTAGIGVAGVVAALTASATLLGHHRPDTVPVAVSPPVLATTTATGPTAVAPGWTPLPVALPPTSEVIPSQGEMPARELRFCPYPAHPQPPWGKAPLPSRAAVVPAFAHTLAHLVPDATVTVTFTSWLTDFKKTGTPYAQVVANVSRNGRAGAVTLEVQSYTDTALANADAAIGGLTECGVPQRRNLPGGGIVQLGPRSFPGLGTGLQQGWAFSAGRHVYTVEVDGRPYDEAAAPTPAERTDHWMPLTEAQLAALTETLAAIG